MENLTNNSDKFNDKSFVEVMSNFKVSGMACFLLTLSIVAVVGNSLVFHTVRVTSRLHSPPFYLILSVALADILVGVFVIPVSIVYLVFFEMSGIWVMGEAVCDVWVLANFWFSGASILSLCAITRDRYLAVTSPLQYLRRMRSSHTAFQIVICWLASLVSALITIHGLKTSPRRRLCEVEGLTACYTLFNFVCLYVFPVTGILFVNSTIWSAAARHSRSIHSIEENVSHNSMDTESSTSGRSRRLKMQIKSFRTFLIMIGCYLVAWTPFSVLLLLQTFLDIPGGLLYFTVVLTYMNSASNCLIYGIFNNDFRKALITSIKLDHCK
ncbi:predicted protein [Nematostella vectensis]|uniref:G-protein coupled receptors family 1 profile domain-containing protein n=2 Tax=Nematostella vectensis TaxID=45351 RepID=A7SUW4_NEMVE|nr:predicted protein [Nematostella vectensis]|eukprot:XP_001624614.1 predicted protein [Nematostella vectensis]